MSIQTVKFTAKDFESDQEIRWCPGCGDYSILAQMKKVLPQIGVAPEQTVFVSGIGCSSRFPYYMNTYGIHSIHGRAPAIATGLKLSRPELSVWVITGDGDGLSIGVGHLTHAIRRNVDLNIVLFNNQIYGLTKGQYSPTSPTGQLSRSTPFGSLDSPLNGMALAIASGATFAARSIDVYPKHLGQTLKRAAEHRGTSFVEVYQNCNVYNDGAFAYAQDKSQRPNNIIELEHGKPLLFGESNERGLVWGSNGFKVVNLADLSNDSDLVIHDENSDDPAYAYALAQLRKTNNQPEPIGVLKAHAANCFDTLFSDAHGVQDETDLSSLDALFRGGETWEIGDQ